MTERTRTTEDLSAVVAREPGKWVAETPDRARARENPGISILDRGAATEPRYLLRDDALCVTRRDPESGQQMQTIVEFGHSDSDEMLSQAEGIIRPREPRP